MLYYNISLGLWCHSFLFSLFTINHLLSYIYFITICFKSFLQVYHSNQNWFFQSDLVNRTTYISVSPNCTVLCIVLVDKFWDMYNPRVFAENSDLSILNTIKITPLGILESLKLFLLANFRRLRESPEFRIGHLYLKVSV